MKYLILLMAVLVTLTADAQTYRKGSFVAMTPAGATVSRDTTTDTDTSYLYVSRSDFNQWETASYLIKNTQVTGTATASIIVQGSNDATTTITGNWYTLKQTTDIAYGTVDTATATGTTYTFNIRNCPYEKIRVRIITGGTQTSYLTGTYYLAAPYSAKL